MSTFSGLNTAMSALRAQQVAMDITGQNVANVNTDGYSRQRVDLESVGGSTVPAVHSVGNGIGQGVSADTVTRVRDTFLENRAQTEHAAAADLTVRSAALAQVEDAFREPGTTGLQQQLSNMWAGWGDVANNPTEPGARAEVLQRTNTLVAGLHTASASLDALWSQSRDTLQGLVSDANGLIGSIADLNQQIKQAAENGTPVNELADKRDALVLSLADSIGAVSSPASDGTVTVSVGGSTLVTGTSTVQLRLSADTVPARLLTSPGGTALAAGGTAQGQLSVMNDTVPTYRGQLDVVAQQLATQLNTVHAMGYDLSGSAGGRLFDDGNGAVTGVTAKNITLLITDPDELAAAGVDPASAGGVSGDNENADRMYQLRLGVPQPDGTVADGADAMYRQMIVSLGVQAATASSRASSQNVIGAQVDAARLSVSGVSIDEEMTNMLQFQHGYQAAGRLMTAIDDMLDTLINGTGRVGR